MAKNEIKQQSLGTRCGKLLNKIEKLNAQKKQAVTEAPVKAAARFDERLRKALSGADADVLDRLGLKP